MLPNKRIRNGFSNLLLLLFIFIFIVRMIENQNRLPREVVESLSVEISKM